MEILAGTGLFIMMMLTFIDVVGRYGFHHSIFGTAEYVEILMVVTIFSGIAFISAGNEHITVNIFEAWVQRRIPNLQRWAVLAVTVGVYVLITYELFASAFSAMQSGRLTPVLALPQWILPMTAAVLSVFGLVLLLGAILHTRGHLGRMSPDRAAAETMTGVE
ncbi:MAG: TRAP transporter small permease [Pseudomonadota bacterium]|nr:TRAP transporter small permease [Pseudomonadota bacterium]